MSALKVYRPIGQAIRCPTVAGNLIPRQYEIVMVGGGGSGYNLDQFDDNLDGEAGSRSGVQVRPIRYLASQSVGDIERGAGGIRNASGSGEGTDGGDSYIKNSGGTDIIRKTGGNAGDSTQASPWSARIALASVFPYEPESEHGKGGNGAIGGLGGVAAENGKDGEIYLITRSP